MMGVVAVLFLLWLAAGLGMFAHWLATREFGDKVDLWVGIGVAMASGFCLLCALQIVVEALR